MPTILAIDDDSVTLSALKTTLQAAGYEVQPISSIDQARHVLDELYPAYPDLILLEIDADRGAGWDLLHDIVRFQGPPTIVISHRAREDEIVKALAIGAVDFLPKPFRSHELLARIRTRLGQPPIEPGPASPQGRSTSRRAAEEPVFMEYADEQALLKTSVPSMEALPGEPDLPLGARLKAARQRRKQSLVQVNLETKIPIWYLQAMEEEKFGLLPRGPAATEMVQSYATYLGLDAARALADYQSHHDTSPFKPISHLGGAPAPRTIPPWVSVAAGALLALALGIGAISLFAGDEVAALRSNLRGLVVRPTATPTPAPTAPPTITPRPARSPVATRTPDVASRPSPVPAPTVVGVPSPTASP